MGFFSFLDFGGNTIKESLRRGAVVIDVRSPGEYDQGKIKGSKNIPVDQIPVNAKYIKGLNRPVIVVSSPDSRSAEAKRILKENGVTEVYNGGGWERVLKMIRSL